MKWENAMHKLFVCTVFLFITAYAKCISIWRFFVRVVSIFMCLSCDHYLQNVFLGVSFRDIPLLSFISAAMLLYKDTGNTIFWWIKPYHMEFWNQALK